MTPTEKSEPEKPPFTSRLGSASLNPGDRVQWGPEYFSVPKRIIVGLLRASGGRIVYSPYDEVLLPDESVDVYVEEFDHKTVIRLGEK